MTRRFAVPIFVPLAVLALVAASRAADADAKGRPNVVYIVADDLGYGDIGAQGLSKDVKTPNVDAIAAGGVRFTQGYVSCPVCSPTRAGLITGRYQQRFGHEFNPGPNPDAKFGLPLDQVTLPQALKDAGYVTGMVGKWHLGFTPQHRPVRRGFDEFFGFLGGGHGYNDVGKGDHALMRGETPVDSTDYLTDAFGREAAAFVDKHAKGDKPFFLYLAFNAIHTPMQAPQKYLDRFPDETDSKRRTMLAMLSAMDDAVGQVMRAVEKQGVADRTLVIFHSDNGGPTRTNGSRNGPLRAFKGDVYEGGIRVPFMLQWKGKLPAGRTYERPVIALDMFPTILAATGTDAPKGVKFDGVNLLEHLRAADAGGMSPHKSLFWRSGMQKWAVRDGDLKLVHAGPQAAGAAAAAAELYDLAKDPGEQTNLADERPQDVKRLQALFDEWAGQMEKPRWQSTRQQRRNPADPDDRAARQQRRQQRKQQQQQPGS